MKIEGNFYLPPSRNITAQYLKLVFSGKKNILKNNQVNFVKEFFSFKELQMGVLFDKFPKKEELLSFLPPFKDLGRVDKGFFLNVMNTIEDDYVN